MKVIGRPYIGKVERCGWRRGGRRHLRDLALPLCPLPRALQLPRIKLLLVDALLLVAGRCRGLGGRQASLLCRADKGLRDRVQRCAAKGASRSCRDRGGQADDSPYRRGEHGRREGQVGDAGAWTRLWQADIRTCCTSCRFAETGKARASRERPPQHQITLACTIMRRCGYCWFTIRTSTPDLGFLPSCFAKAGVNL